VLILWIVIFEDLNDEFCVSTLTLILGMSNWC